MGASGTYPTKIELSKKGDIRDRETVSRAVENQKAYRLKTPFLTY
jgi:hypothetical protein